MPSQYLGHRYTVLPSTQGGLPKATAASDSKVIAAWCQLRGQQGGPSSPSWGPCVKPG